MVAEIREEFAATRHETGLAAPSRRVEEALLRVPRDAFVPDGLRAHAFANGPLPIGHGQTISQPYIVALMTELVRPQATHTVLEIGCGSGYQAAILGCLAKRVISLEIVGALAQSAQERLLRLGLTHIEVHHADGSLGWPEEAPYDGIIVTAATPAPPPALLDQLKSGGRLVIPLGRVDEIQMLTLFLKLGEGDLERRNILPVAFVPLTHALR